jgi:hypothetical protein
MSIPKITPEDLSAFRDFENQILSFDSKRLKYKTDAEMEAQIKLSVLAENFGPEETQKMMETMGIEPHELCQQEIFISIYNSLKTKR